MAKTDTTIGLILGFLIGLFSFFLLGFLQAPVPQKWLLIIVFPFLSLVGLSFASLLGKKFPIIYQAAKFGLVGALNTLVDFGVLNFLMWVSGIYVGVFFSIFKGISFLTATFNSYFWNKHWTFKSRNGAFASKEYFKFLVIAMGGFLINVGIASLVVNLVGTRFGIEEKLWANLGAFSAVFVAFIWNFLASKFIVFKK